MIMKKIIFFLFALTLSNISFAQIDNLLNTLEDEDINNEAKEEIYERLTASNNNLYNINSLSPEEMILLGLNNFQQFCLTNYIKQTGCILSLNELKFINGFDEKTIERIKPYLYAEPVEKKKPLRLDSLFTNSKQSIRFQYQENLHKPYGYTRNDGKGYLGEKFSSSLRYYLKYYDRLEFSFVADKDAGEPLYSKDKIYGYDHYNISLTLKDISKHISQFTIGDYRINIGEGLAINQSFDIGYFSSYGVKRNNNKIIPFRSTSEYNYNKGLALKMNFGNFDIFTFGAYTPIDYNGSSIQQTGYHRTEKEIENKNSLTQTLIGTSIQYLYKGFNLGATALAYHFSDSITPKISSYPYMKYYFSGKDNNIISLNSSYSYKRMLFFSEIAKSSNNSIAYIIGTQYNFGYKTSLTLSYRNYDKAYQNFFSNAIGIHDNNQNEKGLYFDFSQYLNKKLSYYLGADFFYFPFMSYRANSSSYGQKAKFQLSYNPNKKNSVEFYFRLSNRQYNDTTIHSNIIPFDNIITQTHIKYKYLCSESFSIASRVGYSHSFTNDSKENYGIYSYLEAIYKSKRIPISFNTRYTYFYSTDYDNRFYLYEYSLPLNYSSSSLNGNGHRIYFIASYSYHKLQLSLRYSITKYLDKEFISSGNDKIESNNSQYLSAQIYYAF